VLTGLAMCIPYLGFGTGLVLALLAGLLQFLGTPEGVGHALLAVAVVYGLGQVLESVFLTPRLVGERIGLHPLGVILALMLFGQWMGLWGIVVALPCAALGMVLAKHGWRRYVESDFYVGH
jgi:predicted PurR-regulated permease PerM